MENAGDSSTANVTSSGCNVCQGLGDMRNPRWFLVELKLDESRYLPGRYVYTYIHHASIEALAASADGGCTTCAMIGDSLFGLGIASTFNTKTAELMVPNEIAPPNSETNAVHAEDEALRVRNFAQFASREGIYTEEDLISHGHGMTFLHFYSNENSGPWVRNRVSEVRAFVPFRKGRLRSDLLYFNTTYDPIDPDFEQWPSKDLLSNSHIDLINRWRHTCEVEHKSCNQIPYNQTLPSRVLKVLDPSDKDKGVRLIETQGNMQGTYACLSYCWGYWNNQTGRTTRDNLSSYQTGIPLNELPDTVIDAIHLCYKLGFRFLWVDRLCIVQDDEKDWLQEASKMCEIYSRSALTMTVPICHESSQSFLAKRREGFQEQDMFSVITYPDKDSNSNVSQCIGWGSKGLWFLENSWGSFSTVGQTLRNFWLERGWTLQEWMLSPRVLHIDSMTLWDCFDGYANELNMRRMDKALLVRNPKEFGASISWESVAKEYSQRELTREEDRLPALAGLAARYAQATGYTYLAGLWQEDLPRSLLWIMPTLYDHDPQERTSQSTPSWTWASLKTSSCYFFFPTAEEFTPTASIDSVFCRYNPPDSFAAIEKGWIDIDGHVSVVTRRMDDELSLLVNAGDESWEFIQDEKKVDMVREIAQANVYLLLLGKGQVTLHNVGYIHRLYSEEANLSKRLGKPLHGALILQGCGCDDGRQSFRRMGIAYMSGGKEESRPAEFGPSWKRQTVRLV